MLVYFELTWPITSLSFSFPVFLPWTKAKKRSRVGKGAKKSHVISMFAGVEGVEEMLDIAVTPHAVCAWPNEGQGNILAVPIVRRVGYIGNGDDDQVDTVLLQGRKF